MTKTSLPQPSPEPDEHHRSLKDTREHPERTYSEHVEAARRSAAAEYREEISRLMRAGKL